jgi:hypothetical protein
VVIVLAVGPNVREFNPAEDDSFLRAIKSKHHSLRRVSKAVGPMS